MTNTKKRHLEIYAAAERALEIYGGIRVIDSLPLDDRRGRLRTMAKWVVGMTNCHIDSAKRNIAKALRRARYALTMEDAAVADKTETLLRANGWGGPRPNSGRPKVSDET